MTDNCGEGIPKRCFKFTDPITGKVLTEFCICYNQWPTCIFSAYPRHPEPDPGPDFCIKGIPSEILNEIKILDMVHYLSTRINGEYADTIRKGVQLGLTAIQNKLPKGILLGENH